MNNPSIHQSNFHVITSKTKHQSDFERSQVKPDNKQFSLSPGDQVYLYGDRTYTGKLIRLLEHTHPPK